MKHKHIGWMPLASILFFGFSGGRQQTALCQSPASPTAVPPASSQAPTSASNDAALPVYIEEFFLSEAVRSEERGELQFTVDAISSKSRGNAADGQSAGLNIEYGVTGRLQLALELPYGIQSTASSEIPASWSTLSVGVLYQFIRGNRPFALCAAMGVDLPVAARGEVGFEPELLAAKAFGKLQIHTSFVPEFSDDGNSLEYNVAAVRPFAHHLIPTFEFNGRRNSAVNSFYLTPGIYKHLPHRLEVGLGVPLGASPHSNPVGAVFKMTWEIGGDDDD